MFKILFVAAVIALAVRPNDADFIGDVKDVFEGIGKGIGDVATDAFNLVKDKVAPAVIGAIGDIGKETLNKVVEVAPDVLSNIATGLITAGATAALGKRGAEAVALDHLRNVYSDYEELTAIRRDLPSLLSHISDFENHPVYQKLSDKGKALFQGLKDAVNNNKVAEFFTESVKNKIVEYAKTLPDALQQKVKAALSGLKDVVSKDLSKYDAWLKNMAAKLKADLTSAEFTSLPQATQDFFVGLEAKAEEGMAATVTYLQAQGPQTVKSVLMSLPESVRPSFMDVFSKLMKLKGIVSQ
ncbi:uncharacterized protein LOC106175485 [Lingula anatina]|uniref:Uncharacterized protein LOC106175485 n=1 Tax=Lingula anatina TaxID=7574 RepID=A0A1S3JSH5_LINAN|nr:uncharacterized protein LOC106175485 [Lingula anatina]|eukprot:XP_013412969.1 uncharacterized protein LOC106175485 [Lingula anatina]